MDRDTVFMAISHMEGIDVDSCGALDLFSATLAEVAEKISNEEMRRFLLVGAYLYKRGQDDLDESFVNGFQIKQQDKFPH